MDHNEKLDFKVMLGAFIEAEMNNFGCPWGGGVYSEELLDANRTGNLKRINHLIGLANQYPDIICALSAGNATFVFEAFDEPWKGSPDPMEPEKHWGLFRVDRTPKMAVQNLVSH